MGPIVLILSYGFAKPIEIVKKLISLKASNSKENVNSLKENEIEINKIKYITYEYNIKNKYFETNIQLLPYEEPINTLYKELLTSTEALIVSFDSTDKSFLTHVPKLCKLTEDYNIELSLLITGQLFDDCNEGLCYSDVKEACKHKFDVIETLNKSEEEEESVETLEAESSIKTENSEDYTEIIEALENHIWSNVAASSSGSKDIKKITTLKNDGDADDDDDDEFDEKQLESYEALLTNIVNFKNNSAHLNRNDMLDKAEQLAGLFADLMGDD